MTEKLAPEAKRAMGEPAAIFRFGLRVWHYVMSRTFIRVIPDQHAPAKWRAMRTHGRSITTSIPGSV
jgi:hypothetical protein